MRNRRPIDFSLRLYNARGRRIALAKLRYASSYEVYYGKRKVLARKAFPKVTRKVSERRQLLGLLIITLRTRHTAHLAKLRRERLKKKIEERNKRIERNRKRRISKPKPKIAKDLKAFIRSEGFQKAVSSVLIFEKLEAVEPVTAIRATVLDTIKIPVKPTGTEFVKVVYDKILQRSDLKNHYHIAVMDYSLKEKYYLPMNSENFKSVYSECAFLMWPHIFDYFLNTVKSGDQYIFRIKFKHRWSEEQSYFDMGISGNRIQLRTQEQMGIVFKETFELLFGGKGLDTVTTKGVERANYLEDGTTIYITGFTLESTNVQSI